MIKLGRIQREVIMLANVPWLTGLLLKIIENVVILFAICYIYIAGNIILKPHKKLFDIVAGIVLGAAAVYIMFNGFMLDDVTELRLDTRSIIYSTAGLFFSPISVVISAVIGILYRIFFMGGAGMLAGSIGIATSSLLGLVWRFIWKKSKPNRLLEFYVFGLSNAVILLFNIVPFFTPNLYQNAWFLIPLILALFPLFSLIACLPLSYQKNRVENLRKLERSELMLQASIDVASNINIFSIDTKGRYISFNATHAQTIKDELGIDIHVYDNLQIEAISKILNRDIGVLFQKVFIGDTVHFEQEMSENLTFDCKIMPLKNKLNEIIGATVFFQDISEQKQYEKLILEKSYRDGLTGFLNRRFFNEKIAEIDSPTNRPLVVVMADINDLKLINDGFGHETGDRVIIEVTQKIFKIFKEAPAFFRTGGDEFLFFIANSDVDSVYKMIEVFNAEINNFKLGEFSVSVAFGCAVKNGEEKIQDVISEAEKKMYENKFVFLHKRQNYLVLTIEKRFFAAHPLEEQHAQRISELAAEFGRYIGLNDLEIKPLKTLARLSEIGKIGMSPMDETPTWIEPVNGRDPSMKHVEIGYQILSASGVYSEVALDVLSHHERFDGMGYPCGLAGDRIPFRARVLAVLNFYDKCLHPTDKTEPCNQTEAIQQMKKQAGSLLDPNIVASFIRSLEENQLS